MRRKRAREQAAKEQAAAEAAAPTALPPGRRAVSAPVASGSPNPGPETAAAPPNPGVPATAPPPLPPDRVDALTEAIGGELGRLRGEIRGRDTDLVQALQQVAASYDRVAARLDDERRVQTLLAEALVRIDRRLASIERQGIERRSARVPQHRRSKDRQPRRPRSRARRATTSRGHSGSSAAPSPPVRTSPASTAEPPGSSSRRFKFAERRFKFAPVQVRAGEMPTLQVGCQVFARTSSPMR